MHNLINHIGLPKTGTTTLQMDLFPQLDCIYLGVKQPREEEQDALYSKFMHYVKRQNFK